MVKQLYTQADVATERARLLKNQGNIDPIIQKVLSAGDAVCDHDHTSQHCRAALHRQSNAFEGLVFNAYKRCLSWVTDKPLPEILRNLAHYLEQDYSNNPLHPDCQKSLKTKFNKLTTKQRDSVLLQLGYTERCTNDVQRKKIFAIMLKDKKLGYTAVLTAINKTKG